MTSVTGSLLSVKSLIVTCKPFFYHLFARTRVFCELSIFLIVCVRLHNQEQKKGLQVTISDFTAISDQNLWRPCATRMAEKVLVTPVTRRVPLRVTSPGQERF